MKYNEINEPTCNSDFYVHNIITTGLLHSAMGKSQFHRQPFFRDGNFACDHRADHFLCRYTAL